MSCIVDKSAGSLINVKKHKELFDLTTNSQGIEDFINSNDGFLLSLNSKIPKSIRRFPLLINQKILVLESVKSESDLFAGNLIRALEKYGNNAIFKTTFSNIEHSKIVNKFNPGIIFVPDKDLEVKTWLKKYINKKIEFTLFIYETIKSKSNFDLYAGFGKDELNNALESLRAHKSQLNRINFLKISKFLYEINSDLLKIRNIDPYKYANIFWSYHINKQKKLIATSNKNLRKIVFEKSSKLSEFEISQDSQMFIISPHPDDTEIALGGFVRKLTKAGFIINNLVYTNGSRGVKLSIIDKILSRKLKNIRITEAENAIKVLNKNTTGMVKNTYMNIRLSPNTHIKDIPSTLNQKSHNHQLRDYFEKYFQFKNTKQYIIILPCLYDNHPTHRYVSKLTIDVLKEFAYKYQVKIRILFYHTPWAGKFNTYFHASENVRYKDKGLFEVVKKQKMMLANLTTELAGEFGNSSIDSDILGGEYVERFQRISIKNTKDL